MNMRKKSLLRLLFQQVPYIGKPMAVVIHHTRILQ